MSPGIVLCTEGEGPQAKNQLRARRYCRFYTGRRTEDDDRQIGRWKGVAGEKGRWKRQLVKQCISKNKCAQAFHETGF